MGATLQNKQKSIYHFKSWHNMIFWTIYFCTWKIWDTYLIENLFSPIYKKGVFLRLVWKTKYLDVYKKCIYNVIVLSLFLTLPCLQVLMLLKENSYKKTYICIKVLFLCLRLEHFYCKYLYISPLSSSPSKRVFRFICFWYVHMFFTPVTIIYITTAYQLKKGK